MPSSKHYQQIIADLFAGRFGDDIYENVILKGAMRREQVHLIACLALYADQSIRFFPFLSPSQIVNVRQEVQSYSLSADDIRQQYTQVVYKHPDLSKADLDDMLWATASARTQPLDLPLAFFSYLRAPSMEVKVVFWYSSRAPGDWLLKRFQEIAAR